MLRDRKNAIIFILIFFLAAILRLRGFESHFLISSDTARDLLVAKGALAVGELPSVGSFSSSGPFVFGPNWYWFLMIPLAIFPKIFLAPWLLLLALSLASVFLITKAGTFIKNKRLGLISGLVVAISPVAASYATYLTQHGLVEVFSCLAIFGFAGFVKTKKMSFAFITALALGTGLSLHYQMINLLVLLPLLYLANPWNLKNLILLTTWITAGLILPLLPLLFWDAGRGFRNTLHLIGYFRVGQYQIYVPNRWLTYVGVFWTNFSGRIFGGNEILGGLSGIILALVTLRAIVKRRLPKTIVLFLIAFIVQFVVFRYFRGERYEGYVVYFHGLLFVLAGWLFYELLSLNKFLGAAIFVIYVVFSLKSLIPIQDLSNDANRVFSVVSQLPNKKYSVYANNLGTSNCAFAFSYILDSQNKGDDHGVPLGVCKNSCSLQGLTLQSNLDFQGDRCLVVSLEKTDMGLLTKENGWYNFSKVATFDDVQNWWKKE